MFHEGMWVQLPGNCVIERWPFSSDLLTATEIVSRLGLGSTMPTAASIETFPLSPELLYPTAQHSLDFQYQDASAIGPDMVREGEAVMRRHRRENRR